MASKIVRDKVRTLFDRGANREVFKDDMKWLTAIESWVNFHSPTVQTYLIKGRSLTWSLVHPSPEKIEHIGYAEVRIVVNVDKTFELKVLKNIVQKHS